MIGWRRWSRRLDDVFCLTVPLNPDRWSDEESFQLLFGKLLVRSLARQFWLMVFVFHSVVKANAGIRPSTVYDRFLLTSFRQALLEAWQTTRIKVLWEGTGLHIIHWMKVLDKNMFLDWIEQITLVFLYWTIRPIYFCF